jgi:hypothetical protein
MRDQSCPGQPGPVGTERHGSDLLGVSVEPVATSAPRAEQDNGETLFSWASHEWSDLHWGTGHHFTVSSGTTETRVSTKGPEKQTGHVTAVSRYRGQFLHRQLDAYHTPGAIQRCFQIEDVGPQDCITATPRPPVLPSGAGDQGAQTRQRTAAQGPPHLRSTAHRHVHTGPCHPPASCCVNCALRLHAVRTSARIRSACSRSGERSPQLSRRAVLKTPVGFPTGARRRPGDRAAPREEPVTWCPIASELQRAQFTPTQMGHRRASSPTPTSRLTEHPGPAGCVTP